MGLISAQGRDSVDFLLQEEGLEPYRMRPTASRGTQVMWAPSAGLDPWMGLLLLRSHLPNLSGPGPAFEVPTCPSGWSEGVHVRQTPWPAGDPAQGTQ